MARCKSVEVLQKNVLENKAENMEVSDESDSENSISYVIDLDLSGDEEDSNPVSSKSTQNEREETVNRPVFSLECLHEQTDEACESSKSGENMSHSKYVDINEVPELSLKRVGEDTTQDGEHETAVATEAEEHPELEPIKVAHENVSSSMISVPLQRPTSRPGSIPARSNWSGRHNFKIKIGCDGNPKKSESPVYSESRNKLYVCKDNPFLVLVYAENVPAGSLIKVSAVFSMAEHSYEVVRRCPTHAQQDFMRGNRMFEHFVQCISDAAVYKKSNETGKMCVLVPYEKPQDGVTFTTYLFKLTCFNSCSGGINRRPFALKFILENKNILLGRQILEAKVCACPLRDYKIDAEKEEKSKRPKTDSSSKSSESSSSVKGTSQYSITVKDPELYEFLKQMKVFYETRLCFSPETGGSSQ